MKNSTCTADWFRWARTFSARSSSGRVICRRLIREAFHLNAGLGRNTTKYAPTPRFTLDWKRVPALGDESGAAPPLRMTSGETCAPSHCPARIGETSRRAALFLVADLSG